MKTKVLIIILGSYNYHIQIFLSRIRSYDPNIVFDILTRKQNSVPDLIRDNTRKQFEIPKDFVRIPILKTIANFFSFLLFVKKISRKEKYDVVNIHYPEYQLSFVTSFLFKMAPNLIITPWGSDVYRANQISLFFLKMLFRKANLITLPNTRFGDDVKKMFRLGDTKINPSCMGSTTIDYLVKESSLLTTDEAKERLGISGKYAITIGYNSQRAQNHIQIIKAINDVKENLPKNSIFLFPMTYGVDREYIDEVKEEVKQIGFNSLFFEHFLELDGLLTLRKSTDVFIHMQKTDANNSSLKEYLYCDKIVINAKWLKYEQLERYKSPNFILADNFVDMAKILVSLNGIQNLQSTIELKNEIEQTGYSFLAPRWAKLYNDLASNNPLR